jgi:phosphoglycolate phosphatase-like HAD superfamily hydrolase
VTGALHSGRRPARSICGSDRRAPKVGVAADPLSEAHRTEGLVEQRPDPQLASLVRQADRLLLDFDGPVCRLFAGLPAPLVARELLERLPTELVSSVGSTDPHEVLRRVHALDARYVADLERALSSAESRAAHSATPTPGAHQLIAAWHRSKGAVWVVTNNSPFAVEAYAQIHGLSGDLDGMSGREGAADVGRMKPHPCFVERALEDSETGPEAAVLIGNSDSDLVAAHRAGVAAVGFVDRPGRRQLLRRADVVVADLSEVVRALEIAGGRHA